MKRWLIILGLIAPALVLIFFALNPQADTATPQPLFHFYVVTFITFAAAVVSILLATSLGTDAKPRHTLAAMAFAVVGVIFFTHGFATNGALLSHSHPIVPWSAWLMLFGGGAIFALASLDGPSGAPKWLSVRRIIYFTIGLSTLYLSIAIFVPQWLSAIDTQVAPLHRLTIFAITAVLWLFAAYRLWRTWQVTRSRVDGSLAFVAFWLAQASFSLHLFTLWHLSWWLYHFILLVSFLFSMYVLLSEYEHARRFRLVPYYIAATLVATALLGLVASNLFADFTYRSLVSQIQSLATTQIQNEVNQLALILPPNSTPAEARSFYATRMAELPFARVVVYDPSGQASYPTDNSVGPIDDADQIEFVQTLAGQTRVEVHTPDDPPNGYDSKSPTHTIQMYAALHLTTEPLAQPIGLLSAIEEAPGLDQAVINARAAGLLIASLTMGLLFGALLIVIRRGDRIITKNSAALAEAYTDLRRSEGIREDLNNMIVHDLRSPLTAISASLDLLNRFTAEEQMEARGRFIDSARAASKRMTGMIDDMLVVTKIEAGELQPHYEVTPLDQLLADHVNSFTLQAAAEQKNLAVDCPPNLAPEIDRALIGRVVDNLIGNAFKYTDDGSGSIRVTARSENGAVRINVRDNGEGVPENYKERIFDKFAQAPNAQETPARKGAGLGLAFCRLVVEAHGGQIKVLDAPGGGSLFTFSLPQKQNQFNE
jgi:signal transduction histidine kinase